MSEYYLEGYESATTAEKRTQVYLATHDGAGNCLPQMKRSFISFSYGGKLIEDFGLIVVTDGDSITRNLYGKFNDNVSNYEALDGQFYWNSHFENYSLTLKLATDGITEKQLNDFKAYFKPGPAKELILMESPNRAIQARIGETPKYEMQVFRQEVQKKIANVVKTISTTLYKGFITLTFIMDDPFWYSLNNYFSSTLPDDDTLKIMFDDNIPNLAMFAGNNSKIFVGSGYYSSGEVSSDGISLSGNPIDPEDPYECYLYYGGNVDGRPKISFEIIPTIEASNASFPYYIYQPKNTIYSRNNAKYNFIKIGSQTFKITTPAIYTGYNQAIKFFNELVIGDSLIELREKVRDEVKEHYSRSWAIAAINCLISYKLSINENDTLVAVSNDGAELAKIMSLFLFVPDTDNNNTLTIMPAKLLFDSKTGEAKGEFKIREWANPTLDFSAVDSYDDLDALFNDSGAYIITTTTQNVGDMIYDKYLIIEDKNEPNENGYITTSNCSSVISDIPINNLKIEYNYLYL